MRLRTKRIKKFKHFPGVALSIALLTLLTYLLGWSTFFAARSVVIEGTMRNDEINSQIYGTQSNFHLGEPLARVDVHSLSRRISLLDWVQKGSVTREWLHARIRIVIQERVPVAQFTDASGITQLLDKSGKIFLAKGTAKYPVITFANDAPESTASAATFVQALPADLMANLQSIALRSSAYIQSIHTGLGNGTLIIRWGDNQEIATKVKVLRALLALPENAKAKLVDLTSPLSPIVK